MGKVEELEQLIEGLSFGELAQFRAWFLEFDWAAWDEQLKGDVRAGRLDGLAEKAVAEHTTREATRLCTTMLLRISGGATGRCRLRASAS